MCGVATNVTAKTRAYDRWGRLSTRTAGSYSATYGYRFGDKLKSVTSTIPGESASVAYNYDGLGKRRNKQVNGGPAMTWWRWGLGWETLAQYNDSDNDWDIEGFAQFNVVKDFMHPLAEAAVPIGQTPANATYSYLALDHLSSTRAVFNQTKAQTASMESYPYGQRLSTSGTLPYNQFTAKPYDTEDRLYYFPYRYYSPGMDRWTSADPLGTVDGPNVYGYLGGRTILRYDPDGRIGVCSVIMAIIWMYYFASTPVNDKYKHCVTSCEIAKACGYGEADSAGDLGELLDQIQKWLGLQRNGWEDADRRANHVGLACGAGSGSCKELSYDCGSCCAAKGFPATSPGA